jgi:glycosyltransferase involved in cell wall biosynthesis
MIATTTETLPQMRIALVTDAWLPQVNGVVTTLIHVQEELEALGHEMFVIQPQLFRTVPCPKYPQIRLSLATVGSVAKLLRDAEVNAVHIATEGPLGLGARRYCARRGIPFTTSYHTQYAQYLKKYLGVPHGWTYRGLRWFHNGAQRTLVPTNSIVRELSERGFENLRVWTRGVNTELFKPYGKDLYGEDPRPIFLYAGRVSREKNIEAFLDAKLPGTKWVVGDGPSMGELKRRYPSVRFVGFKHGEELARHYAASDVFVFPSLTDTFGIVLIEAMACGVPVAAYPVAGPIDIVEAGVTGELDEDIATAATRAIELDPAVCREHALEYSWRRCAEIFYENLAPESQPLVATR